jgi:hypothetical protein
VLPLEALEQGEPILYLLQPPGRGINAVGVGPEEKGQVLELTLDAVARVHVGRKPRVDCRQLANALPHAAQA